MNYLLIGKIEKLLVKSRCENACGGAPTYLPAASYVSTHETLDATWIPGIRARVEFASPRLVGYLTVVHSQVPAQSPWSCAARARRRVLGIRVKRVKSSCGGGGIFSQRFPRSCSRHDFATLAGSDVFLCLQHMWHAAH